MQVVRLLLVAFIRGAQIIIENPLSSLLWMYQPMKTFVDLCCPYQATTYLGAFDAETEKGLVLRSSMDSITEVKRKRPKKKKRFQFEVVMELSLGSASSSSSRKRTHASLVRPWQRWQRKNGCSSHSGQCGV